MTPVNPPARIAGAPIDAVIERLRRKYFAGFALGRSAGDAVSAQYFRSRLTSAFQPVVRAADDAVIGHQGVVRVHSEGGEASSPWSVFAQAADDAALVTLDRLCRTVHALNYFPQAAPDRVLFLNVEQRLLTGVSADHGAYFESILALLDIAPERVTIVMPPSALENPAAFVRAAISYRIRGYRVLAQVRSLSETDLAHVFMADPQYVSIDAPLPRAAALAPFMASLERRRIQGIARRIETAEQAAEAREAGFRFLQGRLFGAESAGAL